MMTLNVTRLFISASFVYLSVSGVMVCDWHQFVIVFSLIFFRLILLIFIFNLGFSFYEFSSLSSQSSIIYFCANLARIGSIYIYCCKFELNLKIQIKNELRFLANLYKIYFMICEFRMFVFYLFLIYFFSFRWPGG